tara:strand:+ start:44 stop:295 length:252 start_codon:yes stop_codon:yes gene_type:complete
MDEPNYNWGLILIISLPISIVTGLFFYFNENQILKSIMLIGGTILAGGITYRYDKMKANVFTSGAIVVLIAVIVTSIKKFGLF